MNDEHTLEFYTALEDCLDALFNGERTLDECLALYPQYAADMKPDLQAAVLASRLKSPAMSDAAVDGLEARLMAMMATENSAGILDDAPAPNRVPAKVIPFRPPMLMSRAAAVILIAIIIALGSGGGVVAASADSMPGETLYPVKRMWENIIIVLATLTGQLDDVWVQLAETRFKEAQFGADNASLTPDMVNDLWEATQKAIQYADDSPELQAYLTVLAADLQAEHIVDSSDVSHYQFITLIEPVLESFPINNLNGDSTPEQENNSAQTEDMTATVTDEIVLSPTITPSLTATAVTEFESNAQLTLTVDALESVTNTATATSRIPPTPTRTPTPTVTATATQVPLNLPTATITPLPPPTQAILPTAPEGDTGIQPTAVYRPGDPTPVPTWFPYIRLTQDAFYLTRTAEWQGTQTAP